MYQPAMEARSSHLLHASEMNEYKWIEIENMLLGVAIVISFAMLVGLMAIFFAAVLKYGL